jgi:hypothetical protein
MRTHTRQTRSENANKISFRETDEHKTTRVQLLDVRMLTHTDRSTHKQRETDHNTSKERQINTQAT